MRRLTARWLLVLPALVLLASTSHASSDPALDPQGWLRELDAAKPRGEGWKVEKMRVELGPAHLEIEDGWLIGVSGPTAQAQEFLFLGHARFVLATDDPVESYQLDLFTGHEALDEPVTSAVFALGNDAAAAAIDARPGRAPLDRAAARDASTVLSAWRASREFRRGGVRFNALADAAGDRPAQRFVATWCDSPRLGHFYFDVSPFAKEPITLKRFVPIRAGDQDKDSWRSWLRREQSQGRELTTELDDYGDWDTWYSAGFVSKSGPEYGHQSFEPDHYDLQLAVDDAVESVNGIATIAMTARSDGARSFRLSLLPDLAVDAITIGDGVPVPWVRNKYDVIAVLPGPVLNGDKLAVAIRYHGVLFERTPDRLLLKRTTQDWYPHAGTIDRATYRATFDTPSSWTLLGSGRSLEDGTPAGARRRQVRVLDKPAEFFGFEIGKYKVIERPIGHIALQIGFLSDQRTASDADREKTIATIADALAIYEQKFGPYPLDTLTVATTRYDFAQGFLGFLTLADGIVQGISGSESDALDQRRIVAHELAHQWWGNLVGWSRDGDVWLSESLANYAASIYRTAEAAKTGEKLQSAYLDLDINAAALSPGSIADRPLEAMGPLAIGSRLQSSLSSSAYHAVIYEKGAMVLTLLAEQLGEEPFLGMLKEIAQRAQFRPLDTDTVLGAIGKMSGRDVGPFTREFIRGVGYPEIHYDYTIGPVEGGFAVRGTIRQVSRGARRDRVVRVGEHGFDLQPSFRAFQPDEHAQAAIAALIPIEETSATSTRAVAFGDWNLYALGRSNQMRGFRTSLAVSGPETPVALKVVKEPSALHLDPRGMFPTTVIDATLEPKRSLVAEAAARLSTGQADEARALYQRALAAKLTAPPVGAVAQGKGETGWWNDRLDGRIRLAMAEIDLDAGRSDDAAKEIEERTVGIAADADARGGETRAGFLRDMLRARMALRSGDAPAAYKLYSKDLYLYFEQRETDTVFDAARKNRRGEGDVGTGGDYLLFAAAAHATGHEDVCREATAEAKRHGADASLLEELNAGAR
jgi:hypothetical protein